MLQSNAIKFIYLDIRFWILLLFILRLYGISLPPLEIEHNWRQTTVTMVARNFYEIDQNIFFPRVDMAGNLSGITGMEFPLLNYLIFLFAKIFGYQDWYGRLIVLITSSFGIWYFFKLLKQQFDKKTAFNASILLLFSLWFAYSRKIMPDTFATSLAIISLYFGLEFLAKRDYKSLLLYFFFGLFGLLAKLPVAFLFIYFLVPVLKGKIFTSQKITFALSSVLLLSPVIWWYFVWTPYLTEHYGFWHFFMGKDFIDGWQDSLKDWPAVLYRLFITPLGFSGLVFLLVSFVWLFTKKEFKVLGVYVLGLSSFFILVVLKAGWTFHHHNYYVLAFIPVYVIPIAKFLEYQPSRLKVFFLLIMGIEGIASQYHEFRIKDDFAALLELESSLDSLSSRKDLIVLNSGNYPTPMYFAHRKGWTLSNEVLQNPENLKLTEEKGAKYVVILKKVFGSNIDLDLTLIVDNENYKIYSFE